MVFCLKRGAKFFAYGPADATGTPSSLDSLESRMVFPFSCQLTHVVLEKGCLLFAVDWWQIENVESLA